MKKLMMNNKTKVVFIGISILSFVLILLPYNIIGIVPDNHSNLNTPTQLNQSWWNAVKKDIQESEYEIRWNEKIDLYQSSNRVQKLLFSYDKNGFSATPFSEGEKWYARIMLSQYGRNKMMKAYKGADLSIKGNSATVESEDITIEYINNPQGMRQNFIVHKRFTGDGLLHLRLNISGDLNFKIQPDNNGVEFRDQDSNLKYQYHDLYVFDNRRKELSAWMEHDTQNTLLLVIDDNHAEYPITVDPISTTPNWIGSCDQEDAWFGCSVATAGDVNGDGYDDVIIGAERYSNGQNYEGAAFVYHGSPSGLSTVTNWKMESNLSYSYFGCSVSNAGDVNGDGYSDVIIGANYPGHRGKVYGYYGSSNGLSTVANWIVIGEGNNDNFGDCVSTAGDINNDGYSDVIIGAPHYGSKLEGAAYVYHGSNNGLPQFPNWSAKQEGMITFEYAMFGRSVAFAGDVNNDGYSDIIIGAPQSRSLQGEIFAYYGSSSGLPQGWNWSTRGPRADALFGISVSTAGDVNGDGYSDVIIGASKAGSQSGGAAYVYYGASWGLSFAAANWSVECNQRDAGFGVSVSTAGNVNGDGFSDVIVGAAGYTNGELYEGRTYLYYGSSNGLSTTPDWTDESDEVGALFGSSVSIAGDVNGDGHSDVIIGASNAVDYNPSTEGKAYVFHGGEETLELTIDDVWWEDEVDLDGDGYKQSAKLVWRPKLLRGPEPINAYHVIYWKFAENNTWISSGSAFDFEITPNGPVRNEPILSADVGVISGQKLVDFKIKMGFNFMISQTPYYEFGPSDFAELNDYKMEPASEDGVAAPTYIHVTYPNGGETWYVDERYTITWESDNYVGQVKIDISTTGGSSWWDVTEHQYTANDGRYSYKPNSSNVSNHCLFRITSIENPSAWDQSDNEFTIVETSTPPAPTDFTALEGYEGAVPMAWHAPSQGLFLNTNVYNKTNLILVEDHAPLNLKQQYGIKDKTSGSLLGYDVYRSTSLSGTYTKIATNHPRQYYRDETVTNDQLYYYKIAAIYDSGESAHTAEMQAKALSSGYKINSGWATSPPNLDGVIQTNEWAQAATSTVTYPGKSGIITLYVMNNNDLLFLALDDKRDLTLDHKDQMSVIFDENLDREWPLAGPGGEGQLWIVWDANAYSTYNLYRPIYGYYPDNLVYWEPFQTPSGVNQNIALSSGNVQYECSINLNTSPLNASPGSTIGVLLFAYDKGAGDFTALWPQEVDRLKPITPDIDLWGYAQFSFGDIMLATSTQAPDISINPISWNYGSVAVGNYADKIFIISNTGNANLNIGSIGLSGTDYSQFNVQNISGSLTLTPGETRNVTVRFTPTSSGNKNATLNIQSNDSDENPLLASLSGQGTTAPTLSVLPITLDFGSSTTNLTFQITNIGGGALSWDAFENPEQSWITLISPGSGINNAIVNVNVDRTGLNSGSYSGNISVTSNGGSQDITVYMIVSDIEGVWDYQYSGTTNRLYGIEAISEQIAYAVGLNATILKTTDGGDTWSNIGGTFPDTVNFFMVEALDANTVFIIATTGDYQIGTNVAYIYRTNNGGSSWTKVFELQGGWLDHINMFNSYNGIAIGDPIGGYWTIYKTNNGGYNWNPISNPPTAGQGVWSAMRASCWIDNMNGWFGSNTSNVYRTTDGGINWLPQSIPFVQNTLSIAFNEAGYGIIGDLYGPMVQTSDWGTNWQQISAPEEGAIHHMIIHNNFWVLIDSSIYKSTNNGLNWEFQTSAPAALIWVSFVTNQQGTFGWIVGYNGVIMKYANEYETNVDFKNQVSIPKQVALQQNYPNPFNPTTTIPFEINNSCHLTLKIYSLMGQEIATLIDGYMDPGFYHIDFNASTLTAGIYIYRLNAGGYIEAKKMIVLK